MNKSEFIKVTAKYAQADYEKSRVLPSVTIAQAILESAWGESGLTKNGNALFGIKAGRSWKGKTLNCKTFEYYDGNRSELVDCFRAYDDWEHSVRDHGEFLQASRYKAVVGQRNCKEACRALEQAGYATAPAYAETLIKLIEQYKLQQYDSVDKHSTADYKVVSFSYKQKEDADKVSQALKLLGFYAETQAMADGYYSVVSYSYSTRERAGAVMQALRLFGKYSEISER